MLKETAPDLLYARATLLALSAIAGQHSSSQSDYLINSSGRLSLDKAASVLAGLPKPMTCSARIIDGALSVQCSAIALRDRQLHDVRQQMLARNVPPFLQSQGHVETQSPVLLLTAGVNSVRLSLADYHAWARDYNI